MLVVDASSSLVYWKFEYSVDLGVLLSKCDNRNAIGMGLAVTCCDALLEQHSS